MLEIATVTEGARVTMPTMARALLILALLLAPACARAEGDPGVTEAMAGMESEVETLRTDVADLQDALDGVSDADADLERRLDGLSERLRTALDRLREAIAGVRSGVAGAKDSAAAALGRAVSVASELEVLKSRYDYHLRRYHQ